MPELTVLASEIARWRERQGLTSDVGQLQERVERRTQAPRPNLGHDHLSRLALKAEHIQVARFVDPAIDDDRQRDLLRRRDRVVRFLLEDLR